mmetsp:Transcript_17494/g.31589  ORF Transcript_17494/g.31589 Transcript_17494/m.31589 type:complete len:374 (+) Transcript_17494:102-1223(+)
MYSAPSEQPWRRFILLCAAYFGIVQQTASGLTAQVSSGRRRSQSSAGKIGVCHVAIATFPASGEVNYIKLPHAAWMPLLNGLSQPEALVIDDRQSRLYVGEVGAGHLWSYDLQVVPTSCAVSLQGAGVQLLSDITVYDLALTSKGDVYFTGLLSSGTSSSRAIYRLTKEEINSHLDHGATLTPTTLWTATNTGSPAALSTPSGLYVDSFSVYWANSVSGSTDGSIVRATLLPPGTNPQDEVHPLADNVDDATDVVSVPGFTVYSSPGAIYGIPGDKVGMSCNQSMSCETITDAVEGVTSMVWMGDNKVLIADSVAGQLLMLAVGSLGHHQPEHLADAQGIHSVDVIMRSDASSMHRCVLLPMLSMWVMAMSQF